MLYSYQECCMYGGQSWCCHSQTTSSGVLEKFDISTTLGVTRVIAVAFLVVMLLVIICYYGSRIVFPEAHEQVASRRHYRNNAPGFQSLYHLRPYAPRQPDGVMLAPWMTFTPLHTNSVPQCSLPPSYSSCRFSAETPRHHPSVNSHVKLVPTTNVESGALQETTLTTQNIAATETSCDLFLAENHRIHPSVSTHEKLMPTANVELGELQGTTLSTQNIAVLETSCDRASSPTVLQLSPPVPESPSNQDKPEMETTAVSNLRACSSSYTIPVVSETCVAQTTIEVKSDSCLLPK